jgi:hypothetical protein
MVPVWFFILLLLVIGYLLFLTRPNEDSLFEISRNNLKRIQYWLKAIRR